MGRHLLGFTGVVLFLGLTLALSPPAAAFDNGVFVEMKRYVPDVGSWGEILNRIRRAWAMSREDLQSYVLISPERADRISRAGVMSEVSSFSDVEIALIVQFLILYEPSSFPTNLATDPKVVAHFRQVRSERGKSRVRDLSDLLKERATRPYASSSNRELPSILDNPENTNFLYFQRPLPVWGLINEVSGLLTKYGTPRLLTKYFDFLKEQVSRSFEEMALQGSASTPAEIQGAFIRFQQSPLVYPLPRPVLIRLANHGVVALPETVSSNPELFQDLAIFQARLAKAAEALSSRSTVANFLASRLVIGVHMFDNFQHAEPDSAIATQKYRQLVKLPDYAAYLPDNDRSLILDSREESMLIHLLKYLETPKKACFSVLNASRIPQAAGI